MRAAILAGSTALTLASCGTPPVADAVGPPDHVVFVVEPSLSAAGQVILPPVQVAIVDAQGRTVSSSSDPVLLTIGTNPGGGALGGAASVNAKNGFAQFTTLSLSLAGNGYTLVATSGALTTDVSSAFDVFPAFTNAASVSTGGATTCGLSPSGLAYCWGHNSVGELGTGRVGEDSNPVPVAGGHVFTMLAAGGVHECGVATPGNAAYCWGHNDVGELGLVTNQPYDTVPGLVSGGYAFSSVTAGGVHTCGVITNSAAICWGSNQYGQLGDGSNTNSTSPVPVSGSHSFTVVSGGQSHTCGVTIAKAVYCWGDGASGQLGNGASTASSTPVLVSSVILFDSISAGGAHTCGLSGTTAYCWGSNFYGQLGDGTTTSSTTPVAIAGVSFKQVRAGGQHSCGLTTLGAIYCWGGNGVGELGNGTTTPSNAPVAASSALSFKELDAADHHSCAVTAGGATYCWGSNPEGELGNGMTGGMSLVPVAIVP